MRSVFVLFNGKEINIDLEMNSISSNLPGNNNDNDIYETFTKKVREEIGKWGGDDRNEIFDTDENNEEKELKLMTVNSQNPYNLITRENFKSILEEDNEGNWKICAILGQSSLMEKEENKMGSGLNQYIGGIKKVVLSKDELEFDDSDNDIEIDCGDENSKNKVTEDMKEQGDNCNDNNQINEKEDNKNNKTDQIKFNENKVLETGNEDHGNNKEIIIASTNNSKSRSNQLPNEDRTLSNDMFIINNSKDQHADASHKPQEPWLFESKSLDDNNNNKSSQTPINSYSNKGMINPLEQQPQKIKLYANTGEFCSEECTICNNKLQNYKHICCLCDNLVLCQICERSHPHPTFKYKFHFLSNFSETFNFLQTKHNIKQVSSSSSFFSDIFNKELDIWIEPMIDKEISMRPNQLIKVPLMIINNSKTEINFSDLAWVITNFKKIIIGYDENISSKIPPKTSFSLNWICISHYSLCIEEISVEIISSKLRLSNNKNKKCNLTIEVNEDKDEEKLNTLFNAYEKIKLLTKKHKQMILQVMTEGLSTKGPLEIYTILKNFNWKIDDAVDQLIDLKIK